MQYLHNNKIDAYIPDNQFRSRDPKLSGQKEKYGNEFSTSGEGFAYVDGESGQIYYVSDLIDEEYPDDIDENEKYKLVPHKRELGLGKSLAIEFVEDFLPNNVGNIHRIFSSRGAYSAFKKVLEDHALLEKWYEYEKEATQKALLQWGNEVGITVSI